jgi:hypothetical protein
MIEARVKLNGYRLPFQGNTIISGQQYRQR